MQFNGSLVKKGTRCTTQRVKKKKKSPLDIETSILIDQWLETRAWTQRSPEFRVYTSEKTQTLQDKLQ